LNTATVLDTLRPILESADYPSVANAKFDRLVLHCQGISWAVVFDPMLASYVLNPDSSHNLSELSEILGADCQSYTPKGKTIADIDIPTVADYCMDVYTTLGLVPIPSGTREGFREIAPVVASGIAPEPVLAKMEYDGIRIDQPYLKELSKQLEQYLAIEQQAYAQAGRNSFRLTQTVE